MSDETRTLTPGEMKKALDEDRRSRQEACRIALGPFLAQFRCVLEAQVILRNNQVLAEILILAKE